MTVRHLAYCAMSAFTGGVLVWLLEAPSMEDVATFSSRTATSEATVADLRDPERTRRGELDGALEGAQLQIEESTEAPHEAHAAVAEASGDEGLGAPRGYEEGSYALAGLARPIFEAEPVDPSWAPGAESEIYDAMTNGISARGLRVAIQEVKCRTEACRVLLTYASQPANEDELKALVEPVTRLAENVATESSSVGSGATLEHSGGYPGKPTTSEIFLYRSGAPATTWMHKAPWSIMTRPSLTTAGR